MSERLRLNWLDGAFAVCRLAPDAKRPAWADTGPFSSVTRSGTELSIVVSEHAVPAADVGADAVRIERGWSAMVVRGTLDFSLVGILARLSGALADAGIALFVVSTYDTDYVLVKSTDRAAAEDALASVAEFTASP